MRRGFLSTTRSSRRHTRAVRTSVAIGLLVAVAATVPALSAGAQSATASPAPPYPNACSPASVPQATSDSAHGIYQAGKVYYDDANYDVAIQKFREAYKQDCAKHDLLIIISRSYELKGDKAAAIDALETYLNRVPGSPDAQQHRTRVENLKKQLAAQTPPPSTAPTSAPTAPPAGEVREHTVPPWVVVGVGGAGVIVGVVIAVTSPKLPTGCNASTKKCEHIAGETTTEFNDRQSQAGASQSQPTIGGVIAGIGGALVVGGLLWHFLEPTGPIDKSGSAKPKLTPTVSPGYAGMSLGGTF